MNAIEMLKTLVSFPTVSRDSNLPLIDFVDEWLSKHGVTAVRVPNDEGTKANLYATIGPNVEGGIVLSGILMWFQLMVSHGTQILLN